MPDFKKLLSLHKKLDHFRRSLAYIDALPQLTFLGLIIGTFTGLLIAFFRWVISLPVWEVWQGDFQDFEDLSGWARVVLIMSGTSISALIISVLGKYRSQMSVAHVLDRLHNHQGKLPLSNTLAQFVIAAICMITGQSVGREGPAVHLGAGLASQLGQWLRLPNNSMHTLLSCGVAAAISASFDTPLAGVIFAMEVIVMEYTIIGFVPVILASVMGTVITRIFFGESGAFVVGSADIHSLLELPYVAAVGIVIALAAGIYIKLNLMAMHIKKWHIALRILIAGTLTSIAAWWVPEIMGLGYDTINSAIASQLLLSTLLIIATCKLIVSPIVIGLGVPGGLIGPSLITGACIGGAMGIVAQLLLPDIRVDAGFYALLGMAGMMAAVLNAPLAALLAIAELSYSHKVIFPAMLTIVVACVVTRQVFKVSGIFIEQLKDSGRTLEFGPATQALKRAGVHSILETSFVISPTELDYEQAKKLFVNQPKWIVVNREDKYTLPAADLANFLDKAPVDILSLEVPVILEEVPGRRQNLRPIHESASLYEALQAFEAYQCDALYVQLKAAPTQSDVLGIITLHSIQNYYQPREFRHALD